MPASEFSWPGETRVPIFQVYGTKRKASDQQPLPNVEGPRDIHAAKRMCQQLGDQEMGDAVVAGAMTMDHLGENNNHSSHLSQNTPLSQHQGQVAWPTVMQEQVISTEQTNGVMDLCGETFSLARDSEVSDMDTAGMAMDSDCVTDHQQTQSAVSSLPSQSTSRQQQTEYCNQYCGVGEVSPSSAHVRCYCKPSWEGMMDVRPYISDIY